MKDKLSPKVVAALAAVAVAAVALIGWFGLVSPQRSKASSLDQTIADDADPARRRRRPAHVRLGRAKVARRSAVAEARDAAESRHVGHAAAAPARMSQADRRAARLGHAAACDHAGSGYEVVPMDVVVAGSLLLPVQRFLHRLRTQARVAG